MHGGILEVKKKNEIYRSPNIPLTACMFEILYTESDSKSDDCHGYGAFQTPNPCDCWHFSNCEGLATRTVRLIRRFLAFAVPDTAWLGG